MGAGATIKNGIFDIISTHSLNAKERRMPLPKEDASVSDELHTNYTKYPISILTETCSFLNCKQRIYSQVKVNTPNLKSKKCKSASHQYLPGQDCRISTLGWITSLP